MAVPVTLNDVENVNEWLDPFELVEWQHTFSYDPAYDTILDVTLTVSFWDDDPADRHFFQREFAAGGLTESILQIAIGEIDPGQHAFSVGVGNVTDGILGVWVRSLTLFGGFGIGQSSLSIDYIPKLDETPVATPVPEPTTLTLLGIGLLGLGAVRHWTLKRR